MTRIHAIAAVLLAAVNLAGCGPSFDMQVPDSFVELDEDSDAYAMRATSADGIVVAVREVDNDPTGNLEFWVEAIRNRVRRLGAYALIEEKKVTAASGQKGLEMRFGRDEDGVSYLYWLTVYVTDSHVYVIEAGGKKDRFEDVQSEVESTLAGFSIG